MCVKVFSLQILYSKKEVLMNTVSQVKPVMFIFGANCCFATISYLMQGYFSGIYPAFLVMGMYIIDSMLLHLITKVDIKSGKKITIPFWSKMEKKERLFFLLTVLLFFLDMFFTSA